MKKVARGNEAITANPPVPTREPLVPSVFIEQESITPAYTGCGGATAPVVNAGYEQEVVELVNEFRAEYSLPPLKRMTELDNSARYHATDMG